MTDLIKLEQIRFCDDLWGLDDDEAFIISVKANGHYEPAYILPDHLLAARHPDLPMIIRTMINWNKSEYDTPGIYARDVFDTMAYTLEDSYKFTDVMGKDRTVIKVANFKLTESRTERIYVRGTLLDLRQVETNGCNVTFVVHSELRDLAVNVNDMDKQYPGWQKRWVVGEELGLEFKFLLRHIFTASTTPLASTDFGTITFD